MRLWYLPVVALALTGASARSSGNEPAPAAVEQAAADGVDTIIKQYFEQLYDRNFEKALALTAKLHPDADNRDGIAIIDGMRAAALIGLKRDSEAKRLLADAERVAPQEPFPTTMMFEGSLIADRFDFAADALDRLISRFPDVARAQRTELVMYFLRNEPKGQERRNEDRRIALARIGYGGNATGDFLAAGAIDILADRGDLAGAADLLTYLDQPPSAREPARPEAICCALAEGGRTGRTPSFEGASLLCEERRAGVSRGAR